MVMGSPLVMLAHCKASFITSDLINAAAHRGKAICSSSVQGYGDGVGMRRSSRGASQKASQTLKKSVDAWGDEDDDNDENFVVDEDSPRGFSSNARRYSLVGNFGNMSKLKLKPKQVRSIRRMQTGEMGKWHATWHR
jgi:hypothetical protein